MYKSNNNAQCALRNRQQRAERNGIVVCIVCSLYSVDNNETE